MEQGLLDNLRKNADHVEARQKLIQLFDAGSFMELEPFLSTDIVIAGSGKINGRQVLAFSQNRMREQGAMTAAHGEKITKVYRLAEKLGVPIVGFFSSFGGKISEGPSMINGYAEWLTAANQVSGLVPQIAVIDGPCIGAEAIIASAFDLMIVTNQGEMALTPSFLQTDKQFSENSIVNQRAHLLVSSQEEALLKVRDLLTYLPSNNLTDAPKTSYFEPEQVTSKDTPVKDLGYTICDQDSVLPLQTASGTCMQIAFARIQGQSIGLIATAQDRLCAGGMMKAARFIRFCDAFGIPILSIVDAVGFAEESDDGLTLHGLTQLAHAYAEATTSKVSLIVGEVYGSLAVTLAGKGVSSDWTIAWEDAGISPLSPISAVELLKRDQLKQAEDIHAQRRKLAEKYHQENASPFVAMDSDTVDIVIHPEETRQILQKAWDLLQTKRVATKPKKHSNIL